MKRDSNNKERFTTQWMQIALATLLLAILIFPISFASTPILSGNSAEERLIMPSLPDPIASDQLSTTLTSLQSKSNLSPSAPKSPLSIQTTSVARPHVSLSLSGTRGDKGWYTSNVEGSFYLAGQDSESAYVEYAFYNKPWTTYTEPFTIFEEGQTQIYYRAREATGFVWETTVSKVDIDKTPPNGSVLIMEDATNAYSTLVTLTLSVTDAPSGPTTRPPTGYIWGVPSGPSLLRFSNDGVFWSSWESVAPTKSWALETGAGNKTVYVQARDNAGLVSTTFNDSINLITTGDSIPPVTSITLSGKRNLGLYTSDVIVILSATDDLSGVELTEYSLDGKTWTTYNAPFAVATEGQNTVFYRSTDRMGNAETASSQAFDIDKIESTDSQLSYILLSGLVVALLGGALAVLFLSRRRSRSLKQPPTRKRLEVQKNDNSKVHFDMQ